MEAALRREPTMSIADEATRVQQARDGDREAFASLVRTYETRVYNLCLRMLGHREDAADVCQEAFLKAYRAMNRFQSGSTFYTWLFRIAVNTALTHRRRTKLRLVRPISPSDENQPDHDPMDENTRPPDEALQTSERSARIARALAELEPPFRAVIVLRDIEGCDYDQIATILGLARGTVKSRLFRARAALRTIFERLNLASDAPGLSVETP